MDTCLPENQKTMACVSAITRCSSDATLQPPFSIENLNPGLLAHDQRLTERLRAFDLGDLTKKLADLKRTPDNPYPDCPEEYRLYQMDPTMWPPQDPEPAARQLRPGEVLPYYEQTANGHAPPHLKKQFCTPTPVKEYASMRDKSNRRLHTPKEAASTKCRHYIDGSRGKFRGPIDTRSPTARARGDDDYQFDMSGEFLLDFNEYARHPANLRFLREGFNSCIQKVPGPELRHKSGHLNVEVWLRLFGGFYVLEYWLWLTLNGHLIPPYWPQACRDEMDAAGGREGAKRRSKLMMRRPRSQAIKKRDYDCQVRRLTLLINEKTEAALGGEMFAEMFREIDALNEEVAAVAEIAEIAPAIPAAIPSPPLEIEVVEDNFAEAQPVAQPAVQHGVGKVFSQLVPPSPSPSQDAAEVLFDNPASKRQRLDCASDAANGGAS